jgi:hypothetical protein
LSTAAKNIRIMKMFTCFVKPEEIEVGNTILYTRVCEREKSARQHNGTP